MMRDGWRGAGTCERTGPPRGRAAPAAVPAGSRADLRRCRRWSLYVHLPWCLKKCPYCDFNCTATPPSGSNARLRRATRRASLADRSRLLRPGLGPAVVSVFIGGGTPSLFSPDRHRPLLADVRARLPLLPAEITLGPTPAPSSAALRAVTAPPRVTRLSIGVQSFRRRAARAPGPRARRAQARAAPSPRRRGASTTFNLDLMYALPGQTLAAGRRPGRRAGLRAAAPVGLPPDAGAQHGTSRVPAAACLTTTGPAHARAASSRAHRRAGPGSATRSRPSRAPRAPLRAQPQLLGSLATTWASAPAHGKLSFRTGCRARCAGASRSCT